MARLSLASSTVAVVLLAVLATPASAGMLRKLLASCHRDACGIWCGPPRGGRCALGPVEKPYPTNPRPSPSYPSPSPSYPSPSPSYPSPSPSYPSPSPVYSTPPYQPEKCMKDAKPECPPGYAYDSATYECTKQDYQSVEYYCDDGYALKLINGQKTCVKVEYKDAQYKCSDGYELKWDMAGYEGKYSCAKLKQKDYVSSCPETYQMSTDEYGKATCYYEDVVDAYTECYSGYSLHNGECYKEEMEDPYHVCSHPYTLKDGNCEYYQYEEAYLECYSPYQLKDGKCYYEKKQQAYEYCPDDGYTLGDQGCSYEDSYEPYVKCPWGYDMVDGQCYKEETQEPSYTCYYGYLQGDKCAQSDGYGGYRYSLPSPFCPSGWAYSVSDKHCVKKSHKSGDLTCNDGYSLEANGYSKVCKKSFYKDADYKCEDGYTMVFYALPNMVFYTGEYECVAIDYSDGEYKCSSGYAKEYVNGKYQCSKAEYNGGVLECLAGYTLKVLPGYSTKMCAKTDYKPVEYKCSDNSYSSYDSTKCKKGYYQDVIYTCPYGYTEDGNYCIKYDMAEPNPYCKGDKYSLSGTQCTYSDDYAAYTGCASPYELKDGQCYYGQKEYPTWACDYGWELKGQSCHGPCDDSYNNPPANPSPVDPIPPVDPVPPVEEKGCVGNMPFGLENCVCDGASLGMIAGEAACGRVTSECEPMIVGFSLDNQLEAIGRICDTFALDSCISASMMAPEQLPGCKAILENGTAKCTAEQAQKIFEQSVSGVCDPLCPDCARMPVGGK